ncbi:hypothetical protein JZO66_02940 [Enterococcus sp. DIV0242_7C1]|uniref:Uncharacterized protein n=1 Tax=Candidatus Enterococcus dunnyi TaxID=1834192 RepID=A0AAQ3VYY7_9ENTE|nr:hypothetical protein [Enterococcus sp. DIV0242_7C1]MBO0469488.1 hypothetical protein [Enterococcus sp. DIV0242_7C1]
MNAINKKIFKHFQNNCYSFQLISYNAEKISYSQLIKKLKQENSRQVLFNSEVMIELIKETAINNKEYIVAALKIGSEDDLEVQENINKIILSMRTDYSNVVRLIEELSWCYDNESIDISEIKIVSRGENYDNAKILSNGIYFGDEKIFNNFIVPVLTRYFNGE